jgi:serine/threonine protein kinase/tetratricopeptide (TPR) repeat protein
MGEAKEQNKEQPEGKGIGPTRSFHSSVLGPGSKIGHFHIEQELGRGGMGVVYLARDITLGRPIAIKSLPLELMSNQKIRSRLEREAQLLASLNHPNIATIYEELEETEGAIYLILEYIDGPTLGDRIAGGPLDLQEALSIACQSAAALAAAHERGIIHRDLKPGNIKITSEGNVKVLDFGLAKVIEEVETKVQQSTVTQPGRVIGTPAYMSPEQAVGDPVDYKTDIWSLGVVIYEMLTRELPFQGNTQQALTHSILHNKPKNLTRLRRDAPISLERVLLRLMQKDRLSRPDNMKVVVKELESIRRDFVTKVKPSKRSPSIAVLPFVDMSAESDQEYFCDGMAEELINALTHIKDLRVIARTSAFSYKGRNVDVRDIGKELDVAAILEGSIRKAGNRLRITAQLVDAANGHHLWSERYDRELDDVFVIQDEITSAIVGKLKPKLFGEEKVRLGKEKNVNIEAYQLYLKGSFFWNKRTEANLKKAIGYFEQALESDPDYALAYTGLAMTYAILPIYSPFRPKIGFPKAKELATRALQIDEAVPEAHACIGFVNAWYDWDWTGAESEFERAIELNPGCAIAHHWYGFAFMFRGRFDEAIQEIEHALELDPISVAINRDLGIFCYYAHRYDQGLLASQKTIEMDPHMFNAHWSLGAAYLGKLMYEEALSEFLKEREVVSASRPWVEPFILFTYLKLDRPEKAQKVLDSQLEQSKKEYVHPSLIGCMYIILERYDEGFAWFQKGYEEHDQAICWLKVHPFVDSIRSDPRYTALLKKMNLDD